MSVTAQHERAPESLRHFLVGQLNIISGFLELLDLECGPLFDEEQKRYLAAMSSAASKALSALEPPPEAVPAPLARVTAVED